MPSPDILRPIPEYNRPKLQVFQNIPASVTYSRGWFINTFKPYLSTQTLEDAAVVLSELTGNVVRHTKSDLIVVGAGFTQISNKPGLLVAVGNRGVVPESLKVYSPAENETSHRGMKLVNELAADWGVTKKGQLYGPHGDKRITAETVIWCRFPKK